MGFRNLARWVPSFVTMAVIFGVSSIPGTAIREAGLSSEILHVSGHFLLFLILGITNFVATKNFFQAFLIGALYGVVDELHQIYTPLRSASFKDVATDALGVFLGALVLWFIQLNLSKKQKKLQKN